MSAHQEKQIVHLQKDFFNRIKLNVCDEYFEKKLSDPLKQFNENFTEDCILTAEKKDLHMNRILLQAASPYLQKIFEMLPAEGIPRLFISDVKFKGLEALMSILRSGKVEIDDGDYEGLKIAARVLKIELKQEEDDEDLEVRETIAFSGQSVPQPQSDKQKKANGVSKKLLVTPPTTTVEDQNSDQKHPKLRKRKSDHAYIDDDDDEVPLKRAKASPSPSMSSLIDVKNKTSAKCPFCDKTFVRMPKDHMDECVGNPNRTVDRCTRGNSEVKRSKMEQNLKNCDGDGRKNSESSVSSV